MFFTVYFIAIYAVVNERMKRFDYSPSEYFFSAICLVCYCETSTRIVFPCLRMSEFEFAAIVPVLRRTCALRLV